MPQVTRAHRGNLYARRHAQARITQRQDRWPDGAPHPFITIPALAYGNFRHFACGTDYISIVDHQGFLTPNVMQTRSHNPLYLSRPDATIGTAIVGAFILAALAAGYIVASGRPIPIALTLGVIAGVAMLNALSVVVWTILIGVLFLSGPTFMFIPALEKASWLFSMLGFFLAGAAILHATIGRSRFPRSAPAFVGIAIVLFIFGLASLLYSGGPLAEGVRAGKRYFQFFGIFAVLAVVPFAPSQIKQWWTFLIVLALIQLPFALYQRVVLVPAREGMPGVVPIDIVVGTMEGTLTGAGSSSVMVLFLLFMFSYVISAFRERILGARAFALMLVLIATPFALGEVNLIVVLLPLVFLAVFFDLVRRRPFLWLAGMALTIPMLVALGWLYLEFQAEASSLPLDLKLAEVLSYNFGDIGYYGYGLNRSSVYPYWASHQSWSDPLSALIGNGLGSSFGSIIETNPGHLDSAHAGMFIGLTAASSLLWDLGIVGFILFVALFVSAAKYAYRLSREARPGFDRAFCRTLHAMSLMLIVMFFYSDAAISLPSQESLTALTLGLIAWRWRSGSVFESD